MIHEPRPNHSPISLSGAFSLLNKTNYNSIFDLLWQLYDVDFRFSQFKQLDLFNFHIYRKYAECVHWDWTIKFCFVKGINYN